MSTRTWTYADYVSELDAEYIANLGPEIRALLAQKIPVALPFEPHNGTSYGLLFVPVRAIEQISKRRVPPGVYDRDGFADAGWTVVSWVERKATSYPFLLASGHVQHWGYVQEHMDLDPADAAAITALFRAIADVPILHADEALR